MRKKNLIIILTIILIFTQSIIVSATSTDYRLTPEMKAKISMYEENEAKILQLLRTGVYCKYCYGYAKLICNKSSIFDGTFFHGNCAYNVFTSTVSVKCTDCSKTYLYDNGRHECVRSHTGCGLGRVNVCPIG